MSTMDKVTEVLASVYRGEQTSEQAEAALLAALSPAQMAEYIVETFSRGWVTVGNLGIDEDGKVI